MSERAERYGPQLDAIAESLAGIDFLPGTAYRDEATTALAAAGRLVESKLRLELLSERPVPRLVAFVGGTNVGKSTMFNLFLGRPLAGPAETAGATKCLVLLVHEADRPVVESPAFLPGYRKAPLTDVGHANEVHAEPHAFVAGSAEPLPWILIDSPDVDSRVIENAGVGQDALWLADSVIFVTTDQKYLDRLPLEFFGLAHQLRKELVVVFNKMEDDAKGQTIAEDFCAKAGVPEADLVRIVVPFRKGLGPGDDAGAVLEPARARFAEDPAALKARTVAGAAAFLRGQLEGPLASYEQEQGQLARAVARLDEIGGERRREFEQFARGLANDKFYELESAIKRILDEYGIPYVTELITSLKRGAGEIFGMLRGKVLGEEKPKPPIEVRRQASFDEALRQVRNAGSAFRQHLRGLKEDSELAKVLAERVAGLEELDEARLQEAHSAAAGDREAFTAEIEERIRDWLKDNPNKQRWLQAFKVLLSGGIGVTIAYLTGGFGLNDLLYGPAAAMASEAVFQHLAPPNFFKAFRDQFVEYELAAFDAALEAGYTAPYREQLPASDGAERARALRDQVGQLADALAREA